MTCPTKVTKPICSITFGSITIDGCREGFLAQGLWVARNHPVGGAKVPHGAISEAM
jgi:hypothetical protein